MLCALVLASLLFYCYMGYLNSNLANDLRNAKYRGLAEIELGAINTALANYALAHHDEYPDSFQALFLAGGVNVKFFVNPLRAETPPLGPTTQAIADQLVSGGHLSYVYLGRGLTRKTATPNTVVAYELLSAPNDGTSVLLGDGQVKYVDPAVIQKIIGQANAGVFPVTMPSN
jgi:hypothetical protein